MSPYLALYGRCQVPIKQTFDRSPHLSSHMFHGISQSRSSVFFLGTAGGKEATSGGRPSRLSGVFPSTKKPEGGVGSHGKLKIHSIASTLSLSLSPLSLQHLRPRLTGFSANKKRPIHTYTLLGSVDSDYVKVTRGVFSSGTATWPLGGLLFSTLSLAKTPLYSLTTVVGLCATTGTPAVFVVEKGNTIQTRPHGDVVPKKMLRSEGAIAGLFREALGRPDPARNGKGRGKPGRAESSLGGGGICAASATKTLVGAGESGSRREPGNLHGAWSALVSRNGRPHTGSERFACLFHKRVGMPSRVSSELCDQFDTQSCISVLETHHDAGCCTSLRYRLSL